MSDPALICIVALVCVVAIVAIVCGRKFTGRVGAEGAEVSVTGNNSQPDPAVSRKCQPTSTKRPSWPE